MANTWNFFGNTVLFRFADYITTVIFNGNWEHTYDSPSEEGSVNVSVTEIVLNRNFQRVIRPRVSGTWHPGAIIMLEGPYQDTTGDFIRLTQVRPAPVAESSDGTKSPLKFEQIEGTGIVAYSQANSIERIKALQEDLRLMG